MCIDLDAEETVLLFGAPVAAKRKRDGSIRLGLRANEIQHVGPGDWVVYAELADMRVAASPASAAALAFRVLSRPANDGLLASESLILDRRANVMSDTAETAF